VFVGIYFTLQERATEITLNKVGTIKAAAQQATIDAKVVGDLKKRVEAQSATVDLVADSASKAHDLIEELSKKNEVAETKIKEIETASSTVHNTITELQETAKFSSMVAVAQNDDRHSFNHLAEWVDNKSSPYWQHAADAVVKIRTQFVGPIQPIFANVPWAEGTDPKQLPLAQLKREYQSAVRIYKADLIHTVWNSMVISKKQKMSFLVEVLKDDNSLTATFYAGKFFVEAASDPKLKWSPFYTKPLLDWWEKNANTVEE